MLAHVSTEYQLFILTVITVAASTNASEGFSYVPPSRAYILASIGPPMLWLLTVADRLHYILALMLMVFLPMTLWQGKKRNRVFIEAQQLRFRNEALAKELTVQRDASEQANLAKSRFLAAASHDLRQPIQAISLFNDALTRTGLSGEQKRICDYLSQSVQSLGDLLNALLDISKLDAGVVKACPEVIRAEALIHKINAEFLPMASAKFLRFKFCIPSREMAIITDGKLLMSLLGNLIGNALKYTQRGGILVGIRRRGNQALIQVWDTGIGIAPEHMSTIFEEYFQIGNSERDRTKGLGLGLAIAKRIARLLETEVVCRSRLGRGSVFEFRLPLADPPAKTEPSRIGRTKADASVISSLVGRHIVVVEDDVMVAQAIQLSLESLGMRVTSYRNAEEALADSGIADADFHISDFRLPGLNGVQFLDAISQRSTKPIKAVVLTGDTSPDRIEITQSSRWPVLFKPIEIPKLLSAIESQDSMA
jgi:signal transduction histidine kinase/CheY-like chemotaxis protein